MTSNSSVKSSSSDTKGKGAVVSEHGAQQLFYSLKFIIMQYFPVKCQFLLSLPSLHFPNFLVSFLQVSMPLPYVAHGAAHRLLIG